MAFLSPLRWVTAAVTFHLGACFSFAAVLPLNTDFEASEGYAPGAFSAGGGWSFSASLTTTVVPGGFSEDQAVSAVGQGWLDFNTTGYAPGSAPSVTWVDFYVKPVFTDAPLVLPPIDTALAAITGFVKTTASGEIHALDGDGFAAGQWKSSGQVVSVLDRQAVNWLRVSYRLDYAGKRWDLFLNGNLVLADLGFFDRNAPAFSRFRLRGDVAKAAYLDYFYAGADNPLYADASGDGLPDTWQLAHGLNPSAYQRYGDSDHDGVDNLTEFRLGLLPDNADTDADGVYDRRELLWSTDPKVAETHALGALPFTDGFEADAPGVFASGTRLWLSHSVSPAAVEVAATGEHPEGAQFLRLSGSGVSLERRFTDPAHAAVTWVDFYLKAVPRSVAPQPIPADAAAAFYFAADGQVIVFDGAGQGGGQWLARGASAAVWNRLTLRMDYAAQRWSLWLNGVQQGNSLGFARAVPFFSGFTLQHSDLVPAGLDAFQAGHDEPAGLDNDGDGLTNSAERLLGSNPDNADTDGDGLRDQTEQSLGLNPLLAETIITRLIADGQGDYRWETRFAASEGYAAVALNGQQGWRATGDASVADEQARLATVNDDAALERFFGTAAADRVWITFRARLIPGELPAAAAISGPVSGLFGYRHAGSLAVFDGATSDWRYFPVSATAQDWNDYALFFDYRTKRWLLAVNGRLVVQDLAFRDTALAFLHRLRVIQQSASDGAAQTAALDDIVVTNVEPASLDFDGDGLTNAAERLAGTNVLHPDSDGDGLPDGWEVSHALNPLLASDASLDNDGDGLSNAAEYALGSHPQTADGELAGGVFTETWTGIPGVTVPDLTRHVDFSTAADRRALLLGLESAPSASPQQGTRVRGYLLPAQTGDHVFWLSGDKSTELWLSSGDRPFERRRIASSSTATGVLQFIDGGTRQSAPVALVAGQRYYVEVLHKADSAAGHFAVSWQPPGSARVVIPGAALARFLPRADDLDGDGLPDAWELTAGLDPAVAHGAQGAYEDPDADGLTNLDEYRAHTAPLAADTDTDGLPDGWELTHGFNPLASADAALDFDEDGLSNLQEFQAGTSAASADTDGDGLPDAWEVTHGLNGLVSDARIDTDGDGLSNLAEYVLGTNPASAETTAPAGVLQEEWTEIAGIITGALTNHPRFSSAAQVLTHLAALEQANTAAPASGRRIRGLLTAPSSGDYTFWVSADDRAELWLSTDDTPFRTRRLAFNAQSTAFRQFAVSGVAVSTPVTLVAGQRYYVEVLHKNDTGTGHFSIAWSRAGQPREIIGAPHLAVFAARADDADADNLPDTWETARGLNPTIRHGDQGAYGDPDEDGLRNTSEYQSGSNSSAKDTDADGSPDFVEVIAGSASADPALQPSAPPAPWVVHTLGEVPGASVVATASGGVLIHATGAGVVNRVVNDRMVYVAQPAATDFEFTARVSLLEGQRIGTASLQVRASAATDAAMISLEVAGPATYLLTHRSTSGERASTLVERAVYNHHAHHLRLTRRGDSVRAEHSFDGVQWTHVGELTVPADTASPPLVGFTAWNESGTPHARLFDALALRLDTDGDGLYDDQEALLGTSTSLVDTDGDGLSDYDEHHIGTNPLVANPAVVTVSTHTGSSGVASLGAWRTVGDAVVSTTVRAALEFDIQLPARGVYRLEFEATSPGNPTAQAVFPVEIWIDGQFIDRVDVLLSEGQVGLARIITPWLTKGAHRVRLVYDNTLSYRPLQINALRVQVIGGPDADGNGRADWIDARLAADNALTTTAEESFVSPVCVEGISRYLGVLALEADALPVAVTRAPGLGWFADVPLVPGDPVKLKASFENGALKETRRLLWKPFNVLADAAVLPAGRLRIRLDDTLLLTATEKTARVNDEDRDPRANTTLVINRVGHPDETFALDRPTTAPQAYTFAAPGLYTVTGTYVSTQGAGSTLVGTVEIEVVAAAFSGDISAGLGLPLLWDNPLLPADVVLEQDQGLELADVPVSPGSRFRVLTRNPGVSRVLARLSPGGPILDQALVTGVKVSSNDQTAVDLLQVYPDGSRLVGTPIMLNNITPDTRVEVEIFVQGVTFEDGTTLKVFTAADFDAFGRVYVKFLMPAGVKTSYCHRIHVYRGTTYLGAF